MGMGEELTLPERLPVRTPMQWSDGPGAGFSTAPAERFVRPLVLDERFGPARVNVDAQQQDRASLLNAVKTLIAASPRTATPGCGSRVPFDPLSATRAAAPCPTGPSGRSSRDSARL